MVIPDTPCYNEQRGGGYVIGMPGVFPGELKFAFRMSKMTGGTRILLMRRISGFI